MALLKGGVSGSASASAGTGASASRAGATARGRAGTMMGGWEPSVVYLLLLTVVEIIVVAWLSRHLLK